MAAELRLLTPDDLPEFNALVEQDPTANCVVAERTLPAALNSKMAGGRTYGYFVDGKLASAMFTGPNVLLIAADRDAAITMAQHLAGTYRMCSAIVGHAEPVQRLWQMLRPIWGAAREERLDQPLMSIEGEPDIEPDARVRLAEASELEPIFAASVDMFTHEVGVSPIQGGRAPAYRARVSHGIRAGRTYVLFDGNQLIYKADVGSVALGCSQLQGVWVHPERRGEGIAAPALAATVKAIQRDHAPRVSLYVNRHNDVAIRAYERVGFTTEAVFATILF